MHCVLMFSTIGFVHYEFNEMLNMFLISMGGKLEWSH